MYDFLDTEGVKSVLETVKSKDEDTLSASKRYSDGGYANLQHSVNQSIQNLTSLTDSKIDAAFNGSKAYTDHQMYQMFQKSFAPNLLINADFKINQRGVSGTFSNAGAYFVDRWKLVSGTVTINTDGTLTLNGSICQPLENAVGTNVTASVSAGTASYDDVTKTFTITGDGVMVTWAKLEYGDITTQFVSPDPVEEMRKCLRYYEKIFGPLGSGLFYSDSKCIISMPINPKRALPKATINGTIKAWTQGKIASNGVDITAVTLDAYKQNAVNVRASFDAPGGVINAPCFVEVRTGTLILDSEI